MRGVGARGYPPPSHDIRFVLSVSRLAIHDTGFVFSVSCFSCRLSAQTDTSAPSAKLDAVLMGILAHECTLVHPCRVNGALSILPPSSSLSTIQCTVHPTIYIEMFSRVETLVPGPTMFAVHPPTVHGALNLPVG